MYYGEIKNCDIANGIGVRVTLFVSGCTNRCEGCFQKQTWNFNYGKPFTRETEDKIIAMLAPSYINGLTLLGGEPFEPQNQLALLPFLMRVRETYPNKTIWAFSGCTYEELLDPASSHHSDVTEEIFDLIDVLVDGRFIEAQKDISLVFRGSRNQRIIDMPATRAQGKIVLWDTDKAKH